MNGYGKCARCGRDPAIGFASIGDEWYCHPDDMTLPDCYSLTLQESHGDPTSTIDPFKLL